MSSYTPGPWRDCAIVISGDSEETYRCVTGGDGVFLHGTGFQVSGFIKPADARLMAAAPDLLEALQRIVSDDKEYPLIDYDLIVQAKSAIAKATGDA